MKNLKEELLRKHGIFESLDKTGNSGLSKSICDAMDEYLKSDLIEIKVANLQKELIIFLHLNQFKKDGMIGVQL